MSTDPLALYLHLPFCRSKCHYCDFNSVVAASNLREEYLQALLQEMAYYSRDSRVQGRTFSSVFLGGGTPSYFEGEQLKKLLESCRNCFEIAKDAEWSLEANPGTLSPEKLAILKESGINRLSLGVQSFDEALLKRIGRSHTVAEAEAAVSSIRRAGFSNLSLDLIFGLPEQSLQQYRHSLERAISLKPTHLSLYGLQLEEGTVFYQQDLEGQLQLPDADTEVAMFWLGKELLEQAGYRHYEISNFALPGYPCRHNLVYWHNRDYLGLGAGAASYLDHQRFSHLADPVAYIAHWRKANEPAIAESETMDAEMEQAETLMLEFRLWAGVDADSFRQRFGIDFAKKYQHVLQDLFAEGLIEQEESVYRLSRQGLLFANQVCGAFLP